MSEPTKKPSLLDQLRRQSAEVREGAQPERPVEEILLEIDKRLWRAYRWMEEALAHLEVIKPIVAHEYRVDAMLTMSALKFERGFVSYRRRHLAGQELLDYVEMFYRLVGAAPVVIKVQPTAVPTIEDRLRNASVPFAYQAHHDERRVIIAGTFTVTPTITASVRFEPDYRRQKIGVRLSNVDRFEAVEIEFEPARLEEAVLEDLVHLMLGENNAFLRRATLAGLAGGKRNAAIEEPVVYRIEKTARHR